MGNELGKYAFLGGLVLSVVLGLVSEVQGLAWLVAVIAIVVACLNIETKETMKMLLWTIGMGVFGFGALVSAMSGLPFLGAQIAAIITNVGTFFITIAGVFLLKVGYSMFSR